jgi:hypothetical protein
MAKYNVLEKSYIGGRIVEAGEVVEYEGEAGKNLELIVEKADAVKGRFGKKTDDADPLV